jgi:hypothetical protein
VGYAQTLKGLIRFSPFCAKAAFFGAGFLMSNVGRGKCTQWHTAQNPSKDSDSQRHKTAHNFCDHSIKSCDHKKREFGVKTAQTLKSASQIASPHAYKACKRSHTGQIE